MAIRIEIKYDHINDVVTFYALKQKSIREQISKLEYELRDVNATIAQLRQRPSNLSDSFSAELLPGNEVYSPKWTWLRKIKHAIKEAGKPITAKQIIEILEAYEPKSEGEKKTILSSVSSTLSVNAGKISDKKHFVKSISDSGDYAYQVWDDNLSSEEAELKFGSHITMDDLPF